jgi:hypothetical protein
MDKYDTLEYQFSMLYNSYMKQYECLRQTGVDSRIAMNFEGQLSYIISRGLFAIVRTRSCFYKYVWTTLTLSIQKYNANYN